jgi:hypothetical protein
MPESLAAVHACPFFRVIRSTDGAKESISNRG